jgi:hypothetical protein
LSGKTKAGLHQGNFGQLICLENWCSYCFLFYSHSLFFSTGYLRNRIVSNMQGLKNSYVKCTPAKGDWVLNKVVVFALRLEFTGISKTQFSGGIH